MYKVSDFLSKCLVEILIWSFILLMCKNSSSCVFCGHYLTATGSTYPLGE